MGRPHIIGRIIVFSVNFSLWLSGILLIVFGSIGVADPTATVKMLNLLDGVSYVTSIIDVSPYLEGVAIFMIVLGSFLFLLGGNGCHGIMRKDKRSISSYMVLLLCAILIEIALIIYASVYPGTTDDSVQADMNNSLTKSFKGGVQVDTDGNTLIYANENSDAEQYGWQNLEFETTCCGSYGYRDYQRYYPITIGPGNSTNSSVPLSCCTLKKEGTHPKKLDDINSYALCANLTTGFYHQDGCWKSVNDMIWQFDLIAIIISSCLIAAELLGVIFALPLWRGGDD